MADGDPAPPERPARRGHTWALAMSGLPCRIHYRIDETAGVVEVLTVAHASQRLLGLAGE